MLTTAKTWLLVHWSAVQLYLGADVGRSTANTIRSVANDIKIAIIVAGGASIMWGALQYGVGGEDSVRLGKKRWKQAAIGIIVCIAAWFIMNWLEGYATQNFPG